MIVYDIPKEYRSTCTLEIDKNFAYVNTVLYYLSIRNKSTGEELAFYCMKIPSVIDIQKLLSQYENCKVVVIYDSRNPITIDYAMYDTEKYNEVDFIKGGVSW